MALNFCLPPDRVQAFLKGLKDGELDPEKLARMSSKERNELFGKYVGENAAEKVNAEFESKLLLKDQQKGYLSWAKNVSGIKPATRRDLISKIERMDKVLNPQEEEQFLNDLANTRLGTNVTEEEAKTIAGLSKKVSDLESLRKPDKTFDSNDTRLEYGRAVEDLTDYVGELKTSADKLRLGDIKHPSSIGRVANKTAGNLKSLSASLDNSSIFRQGWKTFITNPRAWWKNAPQTFIDGAKVIGGKNMLREVNADIISRPTYDLMVKAKLAIKNPEEAFPESLGEKIPVLKRLYKASEQAYTGFVYRQRADIFDKLLDTAKKSGVDINSKEELEAIGKLVNSLTGRGNLGAAEPIAGKVNNIFFSPRFLKSNIDTLTAHQFQKGVTPFVRKQAAKNLLKIIAATATVLGTAEAFLPGSVDWDPRSTDFGKIKVGDSRFDVTGGMGSIVTLASRILPTIHDGKWSSFKKSGTGTFTDLNSTAFGSSDQIDLITDFFRNKLSPAASVAINSWTGKDSMGNKTDIGKELGKSVIPIGFQTGYESMTDPNSAPTLAVVLADGLGISANTYGNTKKDSWQDSTSKDLLALKAKVGDDKFKEINKQYDNAYGGFLTSLTKNPDYQKLSDDDKQYVTTKAQADLKAKVLKANGFEYKAPKAPDRKNLKNLVRL